MRYLIEVEELKSRGLITENTDVKRLKVAIKHAQDMRIQPALGTPLYKELLRRVEANEWDEAYRKLMEYVFDSLVCWCDLNADIYQRTQITNKTVGHNNDEFINTNSEAENTPFKKTLRGNAQFYTERLIGFLKDKSEIYPEYKEFNCKKEDVKKQESGYTPNWR